jgi:hypothetical protein
MSARILRGLPYSRRAGLILDEGTLAAFNMFSDLYDAAVDPVTTLTRRFDWGDDPELRALR